MFTFLTENPGGVWQSWGSVFIIVVMLVLLYFVMIRPQRKQEKETQQMRDNLSIGDEIVTIGGIVGIITNISEETITIISSRDRTRIQFLKSAVSRVQVAANASENSESKDASDNKSDKK